MNNVELAQIVAEELGFERVQLSPAPKRWPQKSQDAWNESIEWVFQKAYYALIIWREQIYLGNSNESFDFQEADIVLQPEHSWSKERLIREINEACLALRYDENGDVRVFAGTSGPLPVGEYLRQTEWQMQSRERHKQKPTDHYSSKFRGKF